MATKEEVKEGVQKIVSEKSDVDDEVIAFVEEEYQNTLENVEKEKDAVKRATQETLEGIEEGMKASGKKSEELVQKCAEVLLQVAEEFSERGIAEARRTAEEAKASLNAALERTHGTMEGVEGKIKEKVRETHGRMYKIGELGKARLEGAGEGIKAYASQKKTELNETCRTALQKTGEKSKERIRQLAKSTEKHSKELLSHSLEKVAEWLKEMSHKVKPGE